MIVEFKLEKKVVILYVQKDNVNTKKIFFKKFHKEKKKLNKIYKYNSKIFLVNILNVVRHNKVLFVRIKLFNFSRNIQN